MASRKRYCRCEQSGVYQIQVAISAIHAKAHSAETDWPQIAELYRALAAITPSLVVEVNRTVAIAMIDGPYARL